ncbi:hypothetical protein Tco_1437262 [Tanacetum coccineum]
MGYLIDQSASWILILVGLSLEIPNRWKRECGIRLILAPKSARIDDWGADSCVGQFSVKMLVVGRGGDGKGGSHVLIPDLVVMARVGDSGLGVIPLSIAERI